MKYVKALLFMLIVLTVYANAEITTIDYSEGKTLRNVNDIINVVDFLSVMYIDIPSEEYLHDDRVILEYDISGLDLTFPSAWLDITRLGNLDPDLPDGMIDVYNFAGDGVVALSDFDAGGPEPFTSFAVDVDGYFGDYSIDVTSILQDAIIAGDQFLSFRLSTVMGDRYSMGPWIGSPDPVLTIVPEPCTLLLLGLGGLLIRKRIV